MGPRFLGWFGLGAGVVGAVVGTRPNLAVECSKSVHLGLISVDVHNNGWLGLPVYVKRMELLEETAVPTRGATWAETVVSGRMEGVVDADMNMIINKQWAFQKLTFVFKTRQVFVRDMGFVLDAYPVLTSSSPERLAEFVIEPHTDRPYDVHYAHEVVKAKLAAMDLSLRVTTKLVAPGVLPKWLEWLNRDVQVILPVGSVPE